jgi:hypothetical protein
MWGFELKWPQNGNFRVIFFFPFFASNSLQRISLQIMQRISSFAKVVSQYIDYWY